MVLKMRAQSGPSTSLARASGLPVCGSVPVAGGEPKKLSLGSLRPAQGFIYALAGDGRQAYFAGSLDGVSFDLLRVATLEPGPATRLVGPVGVGRTRGHVSTFVELPDAGRLVYQADQDVIGQPRLVSVRTDGAPEHIRLTDPPAGGYALNLRWWGSERIVYELTTGIRTDLFSVPIDRRSEPVALTAGLVDRYLSNYTVPSSDGRSLAFMAGESRGRLLELYTVPVDGSAPPLELSGTLVPGGTLVEYSLALTADGASAVYLAEAETVGVVGLYSVPIDGSATPVKLSGSLVEGGDVQLNGSFGPRISTDGRRVVYGADGRVDERIELFVVPVDGSAAPRLLSGELQSAGDVQSDFVLTPDSRRVLYRADARVDERFELFSVPLDGSAAPARLGPELAPDGVVRRFELSPDGALVLMRVDVEGDRRIELYASPVVPGRGLVQLALPAGASASAGQPAIVSGGHALCLVEVAGEESRALFSLPLDGRPGIRLDWATQRGAAVQWFQVTPDGTTVVYLSDAEIDGVDELFAVPVDGSRRAVRKNEPFLPGQWVDTFQISADSNRVFYTANQEDDSTLELFEAFLKPPHRPRRL
ncbi:MAG: hypothetical protein ABL998_19550, partial [Planctomycetota bacterium]